MTTQTNTKDVNTLSFSEGLSMFIIQVTAMFYFTLLYKITWGWFLADRLFEVGYWELFLGLIVVRFILLPMPSGTLLQRFEKEFGKLDFSTRMKNIFSTVAFNSFFFGILYVIYLIIN